MFNVIAVIVCFVLGVKALMENKFSSFIAATITRIFIALNLPFAIHYLIKIGGM